MKKILITSTIIFLMICNSYAQQQTIRIAGNDIIIGTRKTIQSAILNEQRPIIISLPKGYDTSKASYPVLYLTDGLQNIWHVMGTLEVLTRTGSTPPMIVVGIESTNRLRDFTLTSRKTIPEAEAGRSSWHSFKKSLFLMWIQTTEQMLFVFWKDIL